MIPHRITRPVLVVCIMLMLTVSGASRGQGIPQAPRPFHYDYAREAAAAARLDLDHPGAALMLKIFAERRQRVLEAVPAGAVLIFSVEQPQPRRLEFQVPNSENHDFTYLTGLQGLDSFDSALLLLPAAEKSWIVLYTSADVERMKAATGIEDVRSFARLEEELSVALTDYRDWRITQIRRWPLPAALAKVWGRYNKALYVNYPRFLRLGMPAPVRLDYFDRLKRFSPELQLRDSADLLDSIRMLHDAYGLASLRRAVQITGEGVVEGLRAVRPGLTEKQVMELMDFVYRYRGGDLGFPTEVTATPARQQKRQVPEGFIQFVPRSSAAVIETGQMVHVDTGASFNEYSADIQRNVPVGGKFTVQQRKLYDMVLNVQKTVIAHVRPGVTWWELHNLAVQMLLDAGGYDKYYSYGIGHFVGMEVHEEGDYEQPLRAGMVLAIEQGVSPPDGLRVAFEDNVLVTEDGHEWLSQSIPIEPNEVEMMAAQPSSLATWVEKGAASPAARPR